jgi:hypothetical protein
MSVNEFAIFHKTRRATLDFSFSWSVGQKECDSYQPLIGHLQSHGIDAICVSEGQGLPNGLLYHEELWTLKPNILLRSEDLRKIGKESVFKYVLQGRTDFVRVRDHLGKATINISLRSSEE